MEKGYEKAEKLLNDVEEYTRWRKENGRVLDI